METQIQKACLDYLAARQIFAWRNNNVGVYDAHRGVFRKSNSLRGVSDIIGILPQTVDTSGHGRVTFGNFLAVEVKRPGRHATTEQAEFLQRINDAGGIGFVVHSVDELEEKLREFT